MLADADGEVAGIELLYWSRAVRMSIQPSDGLHTLFGVRERARRREHVLCGVFNEENATSSVEPSKLD